VKQLRLFISILMLAIFGLGIAAEALATDSLTLICSDSIEASNDNSQSSITSNPTRTVADHDKLPCGDPCHYGTSHFGHGSFSVSAASIKLASVDQTIEPSAFSHNLVEGPCLEGPRRPPRNS
jgi:hypothetical protein